MFYLPPLRVFRKWKFSLLGKILRCLGTVYKLCLITVSGLTKELNIKENNMKERDDEISGLIEEKKEIEDAKNALEKQIEDMKSK